MKSLYLIVLITNLLLINTNLVFAIVPPIVTNQPIHIDESLWIEKSFIMPEIYDIYLKNERIGMLSYDITAKEAVFSFIFIKRTHQGYGTKIFAWFLNKTTGLQRVVMTNVVNKDVIKIVKKLRASNAWFTGEINGFHRHVPLSVIDMERVEKIEGDISI